MDTSALTERDMLDHLHRRYSRVFGMSRRYAVAEQVASITGGWGGRRIDFIAFDCWKSEGCPVHGHEVKVSRGDWLTELRDPSKAEAWRRYCDFWWLVVPNAKIVRKGELPPGWGLMSLRRHTLDGVALHASVPALRLTPEPMDRCMIASIMRTAVATADRRAGREVDPLDELLSDF